MKKFSSVLLATCLAALAAPLSATVLIVTPTPTVSGSGPYTWTYDVSLGVNSVLNPQGTPCPATAPVGASCDGLLTIYDFGQYIPGTEFSPVGWTFLGGNNLGVTPIGIIPGSNVASVDSPYQVNLSWAYTGNSSIAAIGGDLLLGQFGAMSNSNIPVETEFTGRSFRQVSGQPLQRSVNLDVTTAPSSVPEPTTSLLMGAGLLGLAFFRKRFGQK
ncbi:MAG: PEP-CTERM sorting domain-containing protein [Acidobacteria bacterium]|nr:PEP-CTERM sorting domain-containing protein [Acidobacteriota bacterium]